MNSFKKKQKRKLSGLIEIEMQLKFFYFVVFYGRWNFYYRSELQYYCDFFCNFKKQLIILVDGICWYLKQNIRFSSYMLETILLFWPLRQTYD